MCISPLELTVRIVASSDATNIRTTIRQEGNEIVINGHKWYVLSLPTEFRAYLIVSRRYISGAGDPRCALHLVLGKSDAENSDKYRQQSIVIVPAKTPGVKVVRPMGVFGYDDATEGHCEVIYENVRVPVENLVYGWGKGFEIIQGRLGYVFLFLLCHKIKAKTAYIDLGVSTTVCAPSAWPSRRWT